VSEAPAEAIRITLLVTIELERLGVSYVVAGSLASSLHGLSRATADVDIVAALRVEHAQPLAMALGEAFYVDVDMIRDAVTRRSEFRRYVAGSVSSPRRSPSAAPWLPFAPASPCSSCGARSLRDSLQRSWPAAQGGGRREGARRVQRHGVPARGSGAPPHVRVLDSIRVRPRDLAEYRAGA
jgi:hypothetical protein